MQKTPDLSIKIAVALFFMLILFIPEAAAQYEKSVVSLAKTHNSGVNWVDIDGDGDLDLTISGDDQGSSIGSGKLYLNGGAPTYTISYKREIRPIEDGDQKWSDFNNDGYPDLIYAGEEVGKIAGIDTFDVFDVSLPYINKYSGFTTVADASVDWGDYDNDGDYDVLISGSDATNIATTNLYRNDRSTFTKVDAGLQGVILGKAGFIDYDLDMDLDIFITGRDVNTNKYTRLWKNTGGTFQVTSDLFVNLEFSQFDWADFNNDGYPDLLLGGSINTAVPQGFIYINNGGTGFTLSDFTVPGAQYGSSAFMDVDNDGDLDAFISGYKALDPLKDKYIFLNDGTNSVTASSFLSEYVSRSFVQFGDYNQDNKPDFVTNGMDAVSNGLSYIANNTCPVGNTNPSVPQNPQALVEGTSVILKWNPSTDNNTPRKALTYNIYMGKTSGGINIVSPIANLSTGFRRISRQGYIQDTAWIIKNLPVGTYYWGVQAIDNALGTSQFSDEATFEIKDRFTKIAFTETPSSTAPAIYFDCDHDNDLDIVLNNSDVLKIAENTLTPFTQASYRTIHSNGYYNIYTFTPNDYNNNNLLDFSISGNYTINGLLDSTIALFGYNSPFNYSMVNNALARDISFEYVLWTDLNNDGKQDLITSGKTTNLATNNKPVTYIYRNMGSGVFQKVSHSIRGFEKTGAVAGDFDNDLDVDIIIYGKDSTGAANTYIYKNNGNFSFTENLIPNNELYRNYLKYQIYSGDFDLNGKLDIYVAGVTTSSDKYARVLLNQNLDFTDANLPVRSAGTMSNFWADYDYDGDLDIYSATSYSPPDKVRIYQNNNGTLNEILIDLGSPHQLDLPFTAVNLDNKNGLDFIMKANALDYYQYYDNWGSGKRINTAPGNTRFDQDKLDIVVKWDKLQDCPACTYNIRVGTLSNGVDIISPMSDLSTGYRYVVQPGNTFLNGNWKISDLPVGTYYWSVQAVDPSNTGGPWSVERTFNVSHTDADFSFTTVCLGDSTSFTDLSVSTSQLIQWKWEFGDGTAGYKQDPKHLYASSGTFTAGLWAYSESGDSAYQSYPVLIKAVPEADFSANIACQGTQTSFTNTTNVHGLTISGWLWDFGDGESSALQDPGTHGYLNPGDYQAKLTITADNLCSDMVTKTVTLAAKPDAGISASGSLTFCKGDTVSLSVPYNDKYTYKWMIGGVPLTGGDSSLYVAKLSGNYTVEVVNSVGNCSQQSSIAAVSAMDAPAAPLISADRATEFCQGDSVMLSVTGSTGYSYQWKQNGGTVGVNSYQLTVKASGSYSLTVTNQSGCSVNSSNTVNVTVNPKPALPTVGISGQTSFCDGQNAVLSVTGNPELTYQWQNNGVNISGATSNNYTVVSSGVYSLNVTNTEGCGRRTENVSINVYPAPAEPLITTSGDPEFCQGDSVVLSVPEVAGYDYHWKRDGGTTGLNSSRLVVRNSGNYSVVVSTSNMCSAISANSINVTVNPLPAARVISLSGPTTFCQGGRVTLSVSSQSGFDYNWCNEDGFITGANTTSYIANSSGKYQLEITSSNGCIFRTTPVNVVAKISPVKPEIDPGSYVSGECPGDNAIRLSAKSTVADYLYQWYKDGLPVRDATLSNFEIYEQGNYKLEASLGSCTAESDILTISFPDAPPKPFIYAQGPNVWYLACSNTKEEKYKWYCNDKLIEGADKYYYVANRKMGVYKVSIGNNLDCYTMSDPVTIPTGITGIEDPDVFNRLNIYPNPSGGMFTMELNNQQYGDLLISVLSMDGKELFNFRFQKNNEYFSGQIDLTRQPKGNYLIIIDVDNKYTVRKIIIE